MSVALLSRHHLFFIAYILEKNTNYSNTTSLLWTTDAREEVLLKITQLTPTV